MKVELTVGRVRTGRIARKAGRKCEVAQAYRNQGCRDALATTNEKIPPITATEEWTYRVPWFWSLTQMATSRGFQTEAKLTSTPKAGQHREFVSTQTLDYDDPSWRGNTFAR